MTVPPRWIVEPENTAVIAGEDVVLQCYATGTPLPLVTWRIYQGKLYYL